MMSLTLQLTQPTGIVSKQMMNALRNVKISCVEVLVTNIAFVGGNV